MFFAFAIVSKNRSLSCPSFSGIPILSLFGLLLSARPYMSFSVARPACNQVCAGYQSRPYRHISTRPESSACRSPRYQVLTSLFSEFGQAICADDGHLCIFQRFLVLFQRRLKLFKPDRCCILCEFAPFHPVETDLRCCICIRMVPAYQNLLLYM